MQKRPTQIPWMGRFGPSKRDWEGKSSGGDFRDAAINAKPLRRFGGFRHDKPGLRDGKVTQITAFEPSCPAFELNSQRLARKTRRIGKQKKGCPSRFGFFVVASR